jgi:hypothetical protein
MKTKKPSGQKVIHVEFKSGTHHYFGSIAAIYELFSVDTIDISQQGLYDYDITPDKPYVNKVCTIYEGAIKRKKGNRKNPNIE